MRRVVLLGCALSVASCTDSVVTPAATQTTPPASQPTDLTSTPPSAEAPAPAQSNAAGHFRTGVALLQNGDFQDALHEFAIADQIAPTPIDKYEMALCYDKLGNAAQAIALYQRYLALISDATPPERAEALASIARLNAPPPVVAAPPGGSPPDPPPAVDRSSAHKPKPTPKAPEGRLTEQQLRDKLAELDRLKAKGLITDGEYQQKKKALLDQL